MSLDRWVGGPAIDPDDPRPLVVVTVGGDHHPFDRLMGWMQTWLEAGGAWRARCVVQHGTARPPDGAIARSLVPHDELIDLMRAARVVVTSGGPSTAHECNEAGLIPIAVPRTHALGEVVDDHQHVFMRRMADLGLVALAETEQALAAELDRAVADAGAFRLPDSTAHRVAVDTTVRTIGSLIDQQVANARPRPGRASRPDRNLAGRGHDRPPRLLSRGRR